MNDKPIVMITFVEDGQNGGPFISHKRIMESELNHKYTFIPLMMPKGRLGLFNIKYLNKLRKEIKKHKPDIVHAGGLQLAGVYYAAAARLAGVKKIIMAVHGSSSEAIHFSTFKKVILNILEVISLRISYGAYGVSEYVTNWDLLKKAKRNFGCIYNLPPTDMQKKYENTSIRTELGIKDDETVVISTGRITREKGYHVLTEAIKNMPELNKKARYIIAGDGEYLETMRQELAKEISSGRVYLLGYRSDIDSILSGGDIFVLCTLHETLSISVLEAAKSGLALVGTNVGGIPEIIMDDYNGYLTEVNESQSVVDALTRLIENDDLRESFGTNANKTIHDKFSRKLILEKIDFMYRSTIHD